MSMPATSTKTTKLATSLIDEYALLGWRAMLTEVNLSPKPGLVDRINCGAHKDMALEDFHRSALAIQGWLPRFIEFGACSAEMAPEAVLHGLRPIGMACEGDMFRATAGVNTHKGSIFSLGLLCAAIGRLLQLNQPVTPTTVCSTAASFCRAAYQPTSYTAAVSRVMSSASPTWTSSTVMSSVPLREVRIRATCTVPLR